MVKCEVKNNIKDYKSFLTYNSFIVNKKILKIIPFAFVGGVLLILGLALQYYIYAIIGGMLLFFGAVMYAINMFAVNKLMNNLLRQSKDFEKLTNVYTFDNFSYEDNYYVVSSKQGGKVKDKQVPYSQIKLVKERKNYIYLYVAVNLAYMVDKKALSPEEISELHSILSNALGKKYKSNYLKKDKKNEQVSK